MRDSWRFDFIGPDDELLYQDDLAYEEDQARYEGGGLPLYLTHCPACHYAYPYCRCTPKRRPPVSQRDDTLYP